MTDLILSFRWAEGAGEHQPDDRRVPECVLCAGCGQGTGIPRPITGRHGYVWCRRFMDYVEVLYVCMCVSVGVCVAPSRGLA
jgi:hypothetical protein